MEPPRAEANPSGLFVREYGDGSPLLLLHGVMVTGEMFEPVVAPLSAKFRLLIPDLRGHGRSAELPPPYDVARLAGDVAALLDSCSMEVADVVGHSHGGAVAQQLALDHPHRVRRLVLACTYACNRLTPREKVEGFILPPLLRLLGVRRFSRLMVQGDADLAADPALAARMEALLLANHTPQMASAVGDLMRFDSRPRLGQIRQPTLVIAGSEDRAVPSHHAALLVGQIRGARLATLEGAGHLLLWTHTQQFLDLLQSFLLED